MILRTAERFRPARIPLFWANVAMVVVVATNGISLVTLQPIIDRIFVSPEDPLVYAVPYSSFVLTSSKTRLLMILTAFFVASRMIYSISLYAQRYLMMIAGEKMVHELRIDLYRQILSLPPAFYAKHRSGELVSNLTSDLGLVQHLASTITADLIRRPFEIVFLIALLFWINSGLASTSLLVAPFVVLIVRLLGGSVRRRSGKMQARMADIAGNLGETVSGIRIIQAFNAEQTLFTRFMNLAQDYVARARRTYLLTALATPATETVTALGIAAIIIYGGRAVIHGDISTGEFFAFMAILMATYQPVKTFVNALSEAGRAAASLDRVYAILDTVPSIRSDPGSGKPAVFADALRIEDVSFSYLSGKDSVEAPVLSDISLSVRKGETIAIVGPSGSGKTTLLSLIPRFHDPSSGRILLDGVDLKELDLVSLRRLIGIVTQDTFLFHDTIRSNIALGRPRSTDAEIMAAAKAAHIADFIRALPEGLDTMVGERGTRLSGGEKQRIAIARALLVDPPILILDEATSSLDSESERHVQAAIEELIEGRTTLIIAHRLSTIQRASRIVVVSGGRIVEQGSHDVLLSGRGLYARLYEMQFAGMPGPGAPDPGKPGRG